MMGEPLKPRPTGTSENMRGVAVPLGCRDVETPQGVVHFHDAPGFMTWLVERQDIESTVGIALYDPDDGRGLVSQHTAESARSIAASLLRLADQIDPREPH